MSLNDDDEKIMERIGSLFSTGKFSSDKDALTAICASDLLPQNTKNWTETEMFIKQIVRVLLNYIKESNDRTSKVLDFHHPAEMAQLIDFSIPEDPENLQQLLEVYSSA